MSRENVEVVRRLFAYVGEYPTLAALRQAVRDGLVASDGEIDFSAMYTRMGRSFAVSRPRWTIWAHCRGVAR